MIRVDCSLLFLFSFAVIVLVSSAAETNKTEDADVSIYFALISTFFSKFPKNISLWNKINLHYYIVEWMSYGRRIVPNGVQNFCNKQKHCRFKTVNEGTWHHVQPVVD